MDYIGLIDKESDDEFYEDFFIQKPHQIKGNKEVYNRKKTTY